MLPTDDLKLEAKLKARGRETRCCRRERRLKYMGSQPPPMPRRAFFECDELMIEEAIDFAVHLASSAPIGVGGLSKTSTAVIILYHGRVKQQSGDNCLLILCDQFLALLPLPRLAFRNRLCGYQGSRGFVSSHRSYSQRKFSWFLTTPNRHLICRGRMQGNVQITSLEDPLSSLLCTTKGCYFSRLPVYFHPDKPNSGESQRITSENVNADADLC